MVRVVDWWVLKYYFDVGFLVFERVSVRWSVIGILRGEELFIFCNLLVSFVDCWVLKVIWRCLNYDYIGIVYNIFVVIGIVCIRDGGLMLGFLVFERVSVRWSVVGILRVEGLSFWCVLRFMVRLFLLGGFWWVVVMRS